MKKIIRSIISIIFVMGVLVNSATPCFATLSGRNLNIYNGSAVLNPNWTGTIEWQEKATVGVYMSNFVYPFVDNYQTAFLEGCGGSNGQGQKALTFSGSENINSRVSKIYASMVNTQVSSVTPIYYALNEEEMNDTTVAKKTAKFKDLCLNFTDSRHSQSQESVSSYIDLSTKIFYIETNGIKNIIYHNEDKTNNTYDMAMFIFGLLKSSDDKEITKIANNTIEKLDNLNPTLNLDAFGNIVASTEKQKNIIIFPACLNGRLTKKGQNKNYTLNFLNSYIPQHIIQEDVKGGFGWNASSYVGKINLEIEKKDSEYNLEDGIKITISSGGYVSSSNHIRFVINQLVEGRTTGLSRMDNEYKTDLDIWNEFVVNGEEEITESYLKKSNSKGFLGINEAITEAFISIGGSGTDFSIETIYFNYLRHKEEWDENIFSRADVLIEEDATLEKALTRDEKEEELVNRYYELLYKPKTLVDYISDAIKESQISSYEKIVDYNNAKTETATVIKMPTLNEMPGVGTILNFIVNNITIIGVVLLIVTAILGFITGSIKNVGEGFLKVILVLLIILVVPKVTNTMIKWTNNGVNNIFTNNIDFWCIKESIDYEARTTTAVKGVDSEIFNQIYTELGYNSGKNIKYEQDISPKLVNNVSDSIWDTITNTFTGQMFLGQILRQFQQGDKTQGVLTDLYHKWMYIFALWENNSQKEGAIRSKLNRNGNYASKLAIRKTNADDPDIVQEVKTASEKELELYAGYKDTKSDDEWKSYVSRKDENFARINTMYTATTSTAGARLPYGLTNGQEDVHTNFYLLKGMEVEGDTKKFHYDQTITETEKNKMRSTYAKVVAQMKKFNYFNTSQLINEDGYFFLTENVGAYFYAVFYDLFGGANLNEIVQCIMGDLKRDNQEKPVLDDDGKTQRQGVLLYDNEAIDFCDLEELFTNVIPYMYRMNLIAHATFGEELIGEDYPIYANDKKSWLYSAKWVDTVTKVLKNEGYIDATGTPENLGRSLVFSPAQYTAQQQEQGLKRFERRCIEFYENLEPKIELLINYANHTGITSDVLIREMAVLAMMEFNKEFSKRHYQLLPQTLDIGKVSVDTIINQVLANDNYLFISPKQSAARNLANNNEGLLSVIIYAFLSMTILPVFRTFIITLLVFVGLMQFIKTIFALGTVANGEDDAYLTRLGIGYFIGLTQILLVHGISIIILLLMASVSNNGFLQPGKAVFFTQINGNLIQAGSINPVHVSIQVKIIILIVVAIAEIIAYYIVAKKRLGIDIFHPIQSIQSLVMGGADGCLGGQGAFEKIKNTKGSLQSFGSKMLNPLSYGAGVLSSGLQENDEIMQQKHKNFQTKKEFALRSFDITKRSIKNKLDEITGSEDAETIKQRAKAIKDDKASLANEKKYFNKYQGQALKDKRNKAMEEEM